MILCSVSFEISKAEQTTSPEMSLIVINTLQQAADSQLPKRLNLKLSQNVNYRDKLNVILSIIF